MAYRRRHTVVAAALVITAILANLRPPGNHAIAPFHRSDGSGFVVRDSGVERRMPNSHHESGRSAQVAPSRWRLSEVDFHAPLFALVLGTGLAGVVDAFAFLRYKVFVGIQTGNVVFVGMGLAGHLPAWPSAVASLVAFGLGGLLGAGIRRIPAIGPITPPGMELFAMLVLLVVWGLVDRALGSGRDSLTERTVLTALCAFPIGILGGLIVRTFGVQTATSYQTGTVLRTTQGLADWVFGGGDTAGARRLAMIGLLCLASYAVGGYVGAATQSRPISTFVILWALIVVMIALTLGKKPKGSRTSRR
ncbi:YoaK family protein [Micromonospora sp. NPDC051296]|uniref:YoaK family protein n=1 Tax=Micromonospora sp. NPDC051296 TaxID=3155046 RepID=UPI00341B85C1